MGLKAEPHPQPYKITWVKQLLNMLPNIVECLSKCLVIKIIYGVTSWIWTSQISCLACHGCIIWMWPVLMNKHLWI